jgi:hypothetical protein
VLEFFKILGRVESRRQTVSLKRRKSFPPERFFVSIDLGVLEVALAQQ